MKRCVLPLLMVPCILGLACVPAAEPGTAGSGGATVGSGGATVGSGGATVGSGGATVGSGGSTVGSGGAAVGSGGSTGTGGASTGGRSGTGGAGTGGAAGRAGTGGAAGRAGTGGAGTGGSGAGGASTTRFSFFVTSLEAIRSLSGSQDGFGGDLRYGEATGLAGADKICTTVAGMSMPGNGKTWRAFLSAYGPPAVNAINRIGEGPWYDRMGRLLAMTKTALAMQRPTGGDALIAADLPNESGIPNHQGVDNHDTLTGSNTTGMLNGANAGATCNDWTSAVGTTGKPMCGHSWPAASGMSWMQAHAAGGCAPGVNLVQTGGPGSMVTVGAGGGYGGFYCFALTP